MDFRVKTTSLLFLLFLLLPCTSLVSGTEIYEDPHDSDLAELIEAATHAKEITPFMLKAVPILTKNTTIQPKQQPANVNF